MLVENWGHGDANRKHHKQAVKFLETHRKELEKRPVKRVPMGFSYERERMRRKQETSKN